MNLETIDGVGKVLAVEFPESFTSVPMLISAASFTSDSISSGRISEKSVVLKFFLFPAARIVRTKALWSAINLLYGE